MNMTERAIQEYIFYKVDGKTERQLVSDAQDFLVLEPTPGWVEALSFLSPEEVLEAYDILDAELIKLGILPDSNELRFAVRHELTQEAERLSRLSEEEVTNVSLRRIKRLLKLLPTYQFNRLTIPIVEYPFPPSGIVNSTKLAEYLMNKLDWLVPCRKAS